jgi:signal transduction histidine kinase
LQLVEHEQESMFLAVIIDITERREAEEKQQKLQAQLLQAQKMEAVGQLAGGIAHDFNNILTAIIGYGNLLSMKTANDEVHRPYIDHILSAANRAASLTQGLLAFSRKQIINPQPVTVNAIIEQVQKLLHRIIGEDIELRTVLTGEDTTVMADTGQIEQVLINLAANARDAMPNGGQLTIETRPAEIGSEYLRAHGYGKAGKYILISVSDSGEGMDERTLDRIFEPFFTTKEVGKGTGLGLAIVYGSIKQHNGYINVSSEPGRGTTFTIYLPLLKAEARPATAAEPAPPPKGGTETILLAEDDAVLRDLARGMLEEFGYTVIEAVDGEDAIEKFRANQDSIQLLILDVIMPKKNGREVFEEVKKMKSGTKVLFTSGYPANIIQKKGILEAGINFIVKPHRPQELLRKIRAVLNS